MPEVEIPKPEELEEIRNKGFTRRVAITTAIVMSSVSILSSSRLLYGLSLILTLGGTFLMINDYTLLVMLPFFHSGH